MDYYRLTIPIPKQPWQWIRCNLVTVLLLVVIVAIAVAWFRDRQRMMNELAQMQYRWPNYQAAQAAGPPNSQRTGDSPAAWCPATADGGAEWLVLDYERPIVPTAIVLHENFTPGAVVRITHFPMVGLELLLWEGTYTPSKGPSAILSSLPIKAPIQTNRIKVYLDTAASPGWNEIDAVGIKDASGHVFWAVGAQASSTWNESTPTAQTKTQPSRVSNLF
jgi:hypothetical protein